MSTILRSQLEPVSSGVAPVADRDEAVRAHTYSLMGALLAAPPAAALLELLRQIRPEVNAEEDFALSWQTLKLGADRADVQQLDDEYHDLFIGIGCGEVVPYGSWYMTGFLMDRPLAQLRRDLDRLGFERQAGVHEPEDHVAALCETMAMVIDAGAAIPFATQQAFFNEHIAPWMARFFCDLQGAKSARFYRAVGQLGEQFMEFEKQYFAMPV